MSIDLDIIEDGIALITINRPDKRNALDDEHYEGLSAAWQRVRDDAAIRVAIITGAGDKAFSAGADLKSFIPKRAGLAEVWLTQKQPLLNRGLEIWKPVIAAVNGYCLAGGMTLLLATDIRFAVPHATFGLTEVKRGLFPANGGTQRVLQQLPYPIAMEMLLGGDSVDAEFAAKWGLINRIVPPDALMDTALATARGIAANGPLGVQAAKELAVRSRDLDLVSGLRLEATMLRLLQTSQDVQEGTQAFAEKRTPNFEGR
jgi:E-phenylitaconyl-CoA hydratase